MTVPTGVKLAAPSPVQFSARLGMVPVTCTFWLMIANGCVASIGAWFFQSANTPPAVLSPIVGAVVHATST